MEKPLHGATLDEKLERITEMLRSIADEEPAMRRRLRELWGYYNALRRRKAVRAALRLADLVRHPVRSRKWQ